MMVLAIMRGMHDARSALDAARASDHPRSAMTSPKETLQAQLGPVFYSDLRAHLDRGAVFVVAPGLDILDCALALATDDAVRVRAWLEEGGLRRPTADEHAGWASDASLQFTAVPVQPYVLIQASVSVQS